MSIFTIHLYICLHIYLHYTSVHLFTLYIFTFIYIIHLYIYLHHTSIHLITQYTYTSIYTIHLSTMLFNVHAATGFIATVICQLACCAFQKQPFCILSFQKQTVMASASFLSLATDSETRRLPRIWTQDLEAQNFKRAKKLAERRRQAVLYVNLRLRCRKVIILPGERQRILITSFHGSGLWPIKNLNNKWSN